MATFMFVNTYWDFNVTFHIQANSIDEAWAKARLHKNYDPAKTELWSS